METLGPLVNKPLFEVRPSPKKGLGVFATVSIPYNTVVMRDEIVIRYEKDYYDPQELYQTFSKLSPAIQKEVRKLHIRPDVECILQRGLKILLDGERELHVIATIVHLEDVLAANAFDLYFDDPKSPGGVFLNASRINHSCVPNADHFFDDNSGCKTVSTNRDIERGEEITISYIEHWKCRALRQKQLSRWGIVCQCPACNTSDPRSSAYEQRLKRLEELQQYNFMDNTGRLNNSASGSRIVLERAAKQTQQLIELLTTSGYFRTLVRQANLVAFHVALAEYNWNERPSKLTDAISYLEQVIEQDLTYYGKTHVETQKDQKLCRQLKQGYIPQRFDVYLNHGVHERIYT